MARKFQLPPHANSNRENPFVDEDGKNPFSADSTADAAEMESAPDEAAGRTYQPRGHVTTSAHRGKLVIGLGITGTLIAMVGIIGSGIAQVAQYGEIDELYVMGLFPLSIFSIAISLPAWVIGHGDLQAIDAGAMDPAGRKSTATGRALGVTGTLLGIVGFAYFFVRLYSVTT